MSEFVLTNATLVPSREIIALSNVTTLNAGSVTFLTALGTASGGLGTTTAAQNTVFAGPVSGGSGAPSFRALSSVDVPGLSTTYGSGQILYGAGSGTPTSTSAFTYSAGNMTVGTVNLSPPSHRWAQSFTSSAYNAAGSWYIAVASQTNSSSYSGVLNIRGTIGQWNSAQGTSIFASVCVRDTYMVTGIAVGGNPTSSVDITIYNNSGTYTVFLKITGQTNGYYDLTFDGGDGGSSSWTINSVSTTATQMTPPGTVSTASLWSALTQFTSNGIGINTLLPSANIHVTGNVYASNALSTVNVFTNTLTVANTASFTGPVSVTGNLYASNALTTTNVFASTETLTGTSGQTTSTMTGNLYVSNAITTLNLFTNTLTVANTASFTGRVGLGVVPTALTETFTVSGNTSFVGNVTQVTDASGSAYTSARRVPTGSLPVSNYVTGSVPLTTTTNLIQNYLSNAATIGTQNSNVSLSFPGTVNSVVAFPPGGHSLNFSNLAVSNLFVEAWVYKTGTTQGVILSRGAATSAYDFDLIIRSGNPGTFQLDLNTTAGFVAIGAATVPLNTWTHVAASYVRDVGSATTGNAWVFVNGSAGTRTALTNRIVYTPTANVIIGGDGIAGTGFTDWFPGFVQDVRVMTGSVVPTTNFVGSPQVGPFTTAPTYALGMSTGYTSNLTLALQSQYFPGASTSPYGPCLTLPGTVGSYYSYPTTSAINTQWNTNGFCLEVWVNYASLANSNTYLSSSSYSYMIQRGNAPVTGGDFAVGVLNNGAVSINWTNVGVGNNGVSTPASVVTTGQWTHILAQGNGSNVYVAINGVFQTLTGQNYTPTNGNNSIAPTVAPATVIATATYPLSVGQWGGNAGPNFAIAKARLVFGTSGNPALGNVYSSGNFTASPNFASVPAGATVAWQLETQYPLPTFPSIQDVTELPQQASSYGSLPTPVGGVTSNTLSPYTGTQLQSLRFDGTGYIDYGNAATSVMCSNIWNSNFTFEAWVYCLTSTFSAAQVILGRGPSYYVSAPIPFDMLFWIQASGSPQFYWNSAVGYVSSSATVNVGWNHIAVVNNGTTVYMYLNGTQTGTSSTPTNGVFYPSYNTYIGYQGPYIVNYNTGGTTGLPTFNLADVRVSNVARYTGTSFTVPTAQMPFVNDANTLLLLKSLAQQPGTTLEVQGRGLNATSLGATRSIQSYPPAPMSSYLLDTTSNASVSYGQGKYVASASSEYNYLNTAWMAFDKINGFGNGGTWGSQATYSGSTYTGSVVTVDTLGNSYAGEWLQIQLPVSILLSSYSWTSQTNVTGTNPSTLVVLGSRDGTNWTLVNYQVGISSWVVSSAITFQVGATQAYNYYRFCVPKVVGGFSVVGCGELTLNGTEESICVTNDSKVGVGIANPQRSLEVAGDLVVGGTISGGAGMGSFRNRIINGDMRIAQRGATAYIAPATGGSAIYGSLDRWFTWTKVAGLISVQQSSTVPLGLGFTNSWLITSLSGYTVVSGDYHGIGQYIEGYNIADLNWGTSYGSPITLSFWVRSSTTGNYSFSLEGGGGFSPSYAVQYTINNPNTWQQIVLTIPPPPNGYTANFSNANGAGVRLWWDMGSADVTYAVTTPGVWQAGDKIRVAGSTNFISTNGATMYLTGVQLEKGTVATPFEFRPYATELQLCQRYYHQITSTGSGTSSATNFAIGYVRGAGSASAYLTLPVSMRAVPTFSYTAPMQFDWNGVANLGQFTSVVLNTTKTDTKYVELDGSVTGGTQGQAGAIEFASSATPAATAGQYVAFNAEL